MALLDVLLLGRIFASTAAFANDFVLMPEILSNAALASAASSPLPSTPR